jgi:hypothetical protein
MPEHIIGSRETYIPLTMGMNRMYGVWVMQIRTYRISEGGASPF